MDEKMSAGGGSAMGGKNKILKLFLISSLAVLGSTFFISGANAQNPDSEDVFQEAEAVAVATVNIYDAKIVSRDGNSFKISFDLSNRENAQPGIKYAVQLIKQESDIQTLYDEKIYPETVSLGADNTIKKEIEYTAPSYLGGKFQLWLISKNENGLMLALGNLGEVTLTGDNQFVEIVNNSCYLNVEGEETNAKYTLNQGVDIAGNENLIGVCDIVNHYDKQITVFPEFETYWRTTFGKKVEDNNQPQQAITLNPKEKKIISLALPKAQDPQAYDAKLTLLENNRLISNPAVFHYVLRGPSATIQNLRLDKDYYQKGETAAVSFFWSPSADSFPDSRSGATDNGQIYVNIAIKNKENKNCSNDAREKINPQDPMAVYDLPITSECADPKISVSIRDEKDNILDQKEYFLTSQNVQPKVIAKTEPEKEQKSSLLLYGIIFIVVLTIISLILVFAKKRKISSALIFFLILSGGMFLAGEGAKADTFTVMGEIFTANLNKQAYAPGETINAAGSYTSGACNNGATSLPAALSVTINGLSKQVFDVYGLSSGHVAWGSATGTAQSLFGNYSAIFKASQNTTSSNYGPIACMRDGGSFRKKSSGIISLGGTCTKTVPIPYSVVCTDTSWFPNPNAVCSGTSFTQTSNCGKTRTVAGVKNCCTPNCGCAAGTCAGLTCSNGCGGTCAGTKVCACAGNGCASSTCVGSTCWDGCQLQSGTFLPTNGFCGSANGATVAAVPTSNLCDTGTPSAITGSGPWSWTCSGICGGSFVSCGAGKETASDWKEVAP